jgi:hypothetical protein
LALSPLLKPDFRSAWRCLAADFLHVHGTIAAASRIGLRIILHGVIALQLVKRDAHQGGRMEEKVFPTLLLLNETKAPVGDSCDCTLCHCVLISAMRGGSVRSSVNAKSIWRLQ